MKSALLVVLVLTAVALAQAGPAVAPASQTAVVESARSVTDALTKARCYVKALGQLARFVADIPRKCVDLSLRSDKFLLFVFPVCIAYFCVATYPLTTSLISACQY